MAGPLINFSGLASGIDSEALIDATVEARRLQKVVPHEESIAEIEDENTALEDVQTMLTELKDIVYGFTTLAGGVVEKEATSSNEAVLTASASNTASDGTYEITVNQLAENETFSFADSITDTGDEIETAALGPYTYDFTVGTDAVSIDVSGDGAGGGMTYAEFVDEFNNQTDLATASFVNTGTAASPDYRLVIISHNVGTEKGAVSLSVTGGNPSTGNLNPATVQEDDAQDAQLTINGIAGTFTRSSNSISDIIQGVTFNLVDTDTNTITVKVGNDPTSTKANVQSFVDKYNEIVEYLYENNLVVSEQEGDEITNVFGPLAATKVDEGLLSALRSAMSSSSYENGTEVRIFADMGITTDRDGTLLLDGSTWTGAPTFEEALEAEPESVKEIFQAFADKVALTSGTIEQYTRFGGLIDNVTNGNDTLIKDLNDRIARAEASIAKEEQMLRARFARLEGTISQMQSQQSALTSALAGLGAG